VAFKVKTDNLKATVAAIQNLARKEVLVGVPASKAPREADPSQPSEEVNNAYLSLIHNNGSPANNIPARPFLIPGIESVKPEIKGGMRQAAEFGLVGNSVAMDNALREVGRIAREAVILKITEGPFAPLAPATLAARRRRNFKGDKPLIVTGQLRAAQTFVIRDKD
jgi:hypothetical protein